jgi:hypothetical protein
MEEGLCKSIACAAHGCGMSHHLVSSLPSINEICKFNVVYL